MENTKIKHFEWLPNFLEAASRLKHLQDVEKVNRALNTIQTLDPIENFDESLTDTERQIISQSTSASAVGNKSQIQSALKNFLDLTDADELIITSQIFDHQARCDSYSIVWEALNEIQDDLAFSAG